MMILILIPTSALNNNERNYRYDYDWNKADQDHTVTVLNETHFGLI